MSIMAWILVGNQWNSVLCDSFFIVVEAVWKKFIKVQIPPTDSQTAWKCFWLKGGVNTTLNSEVTACITYSSIWSAIKDGATIQFQMKNYLDCVWIWQHDVIKIVLSMCKLFLISWYWPIKIAFYKKLWNTLRSYWCVYIIYARGLLTH